MQIFTDSLHFVSILFFCYNINLIYVCVLIYLFPFYYYDDRQIIRNFSIVPQPIFKRRIIRIDSSTLHDLLKNIGCRDPTFYKPNGNLRKFEEADVQECINRL